MGAEEVYVYAAQGVLLDTEWLSGSCVKKMGKNLELWLVIY